MNGTNRAFTLLELMVVVAIMGLMGTITVGGYRAMRQGMEERGTMQNVNQFIRNAYQRAMIDRQPTTVYFWNETRRDDNDDGNAMLVVGRAVAVRRAGRVSRVDRSNSCLVDEFGDFRYYRGTNEDGEDDDSEAKNGAKTYIYMANGDETQYKPYAVSQVTMAARAQAVFPMMTDSSWRDNNADAKVEVYGYYVEGGLGDWHVGDAYGLEFASITLPNNYIFGTGGGSFSKSVSDPVKVVSTVLHFSPEKGAGGQTVSLSVLRPGKSGAPEAQTIGTTEPADSAQSKQNE